MFTKLKTKWAIPPSVFVAWGVLNALSTIQFVADKMQSANLVSIWQWIISPVGNLVIIVIGLLWLAHLATRQPKNNTQFYDGRSDAPELKEIFGHCQKVWCLVRTGTTLKEKDFISLPSVTTVVLTHPYGEYAASQAKLQGISQSFVPEIEDITKKLRRPGTSVWWYDGSIFKGLLPSEWVIFA
jgi:hypothetical protein